jgi:hypothetical protein
MASARMLRTGRGASRRLQVVLCYLAFLLLVVECGARSFWSLRGVPFLTAHRELYRSFYPELTELDAYWAARGEKHAAQDARTFEVLLLGGSVLHTRYGDVEHLLRERLVRATHGPVHIANLAQPGHTSRDSLLKYRHLASRRFDLVIVYHGINDVRADACEAGSYRADYGHLDWYRLLNDAESRCTSQGLVAGYTLGFMASRVRERLRGEAPWRAPVASGAAGSGSGSGSGGAADGDAAPGVKTARSLAQNFEEILALARGRGEPVLLMTFASYLPDGYSEAAFEAGTLDFTTHLLPVELWGRPDRVLAALGRHNAAVRELAAAHPEALFVDQDALFPREGLYFNDVCHLTHEGCERLVENLLPAALQAHQRSERGALVSLCACDPTSACACEAESPRPAEPALLRAGLAATR